MSLIQYHVVPFPRQQQILIDPHTRVGGDQNPTGWGSEGGREGAREGEREGARGGERERGREGVSE